MKKQTRNLLIAAVVVLVIAVLAYWYWFTKDTAKLTVTNVGVDSTGAATLTVSTKSKSDPSTWAGKKISVHTKSLGKFSSTITKASITNGAGTVVTAASAYSGKAAYSADKSDYARVTLKY